LLQIQKATSFNDNLPYLKFLVVEYLQQIQWHDIVEPFQECLRLGLDASREPPISHQPGERETPISTSLEMQLSAHRSLELARAN
jgi:hypothetical protein